MGLTLDHVYLDSCIVIYLLEDHPKFGSPVRQAFTNAQNQHFCISPLVALECLVGPLRAGDTLLIQRYEHFFQGQIVLDIHHSIYYLAANLRANHRIKTPDALHLAIAQYYGCSELWTNDDRLNVAAKHTAINILSGLQP